MSPSAALPVPPADASDAEAMHKYVKQLEQFIEAEVQRIDERIIQSRALRHGPKYQPDDEIAALKAQGVLIDYTLAEVPLTSPPPTPARNVSEVTASPPASPAHERTPSETATPKAAAAAARTSAASPIAARSTPGSNRSATPLTPEEARPRIYAMYKKYAPEKMANVDAMMTKYKGVEQQLLQALVTKYGPEPEPEPEAEPEPQEQAATPGKEPVGGEESNTASPTNAAATPVSKGAANTTAAASPEAATSSAPASPSNVSGTASPSHQREGSTASSVASASPSASGGGTIFDTLAKTGKKQGMLSNWGKKRFFRSFEDNYVVVNEQGVQWYKSERDVRGGKPAELVPFYVLTTNSRGSRFKNAAVCWPLITTQECPKATDPKKTYFGVQYTEPGKDNNLEFLVFGASSPEERDEWVFVLTKYIKLYLAPSPDFLAFEHMKVGAETPLHLHGVIDGEAPR